MVSAASFEESARQLGRALEGEGHPVLGSSLLEVLPASGVVPTGELRELIADRLGRLAEAADISPRLRATAARLAATAADAMLLRGRSGTAWIAWDDGDNGPGGPPPGEPCYWVSWQSDDGSDWVEHGPAFAELGEALAWARERTDAVIVRPSWDHGTHYWAGSGTDRRGLPLLAESPGGRG